MKSLKSIKALGIITVLLLSGIRLVFAQTHCSILIVGQSLGLGIYEQRAGIAEVINTDDFKAKTNCSSVNFINGTSTGSAADCAIAQDSMNCWINHDPNYNGGKRFGNAFLRARKRIDDIMNNPDSTKRRRIIGIIWSQGEADSVYITKEVPGIITEPYNLCTVPQLYCKAAYKNNVAEIFSTLRSYIADYSNTNFGILIDGKDVPVFMPVIGRRAFRSNALTSLIKEFDIGIQTIRQAQYEIIKEGTHIYIAALGYDQPLQAIAASKVCQPHLTTSGYLETARRLGFSIQRYFSHIPPYLGQKAIAYLGPKVVAVSWDGVDIMVTVAHTLKTSMSDALNCTFPTYCGFVVFDGNTSSLPIEVRKDGSPYVVNKLKHTKYRIKLLIQPNNSNIDLAFAFGAMNEINVVTALAGADSNNMSKTFLEDCISTVSFDESDTINTINFARTSSGVATNIAKNILMQKCQIAGSASECAGAENRTLPIQPAFFSSRNRVFFNKLNN